MHFKLNILVISCLVYLRINSVLGLKCHVCSSHVRGEEGCLNIAEGDSRFLQECNLGEVSCRIQEQSVDFEVLGQKHVPRTIRQCATTPFDANRPCYARAGFGGKVNVCNCDQDGCNAGPPGLAGNISMIVFAFVSILMVKKMMF